MKDFLKYLEVSRTDTNPIPSDHAEIAGRMLMYNFISSEEGKELCEEIFGFPFVQRERNLMGLLHTVTLVLGYILEHGMPQKLVDFYYNSGPAIIADLDEALEKIETFGREQGMDAAKIEKLKEDSGINIGAVEEHFLPWEPLAEPHI